MVGGQCDLIKAGGVRSDGKHGAGRQVELYARCTLKLTGYARSHNEGRVFADDLDLHDLGSLRGQLDGQLIPVAVRICGKAGGNRVGVAVDALAAPGRDSGDIGAGLGNDRDGLAFLGLHDSIIAVGAGIIADRELDLALSLAVDQNLDLPDRGFLLSEVSLQDDRACGQLELPQRGNVVAVGVGLVNHIAILINIADEVCGVVLAVDIDLEVANSELLVAAAGNTVDIDGLADLEFIKAAGRRVLVRGLLEHQRAVCHLGADENGGQGIGDVAELDVHVDGGGGHQEGDTLAAVGHVDVIDGLAVLGANIDLIDASALGHCKLAAGDLNRGIVCDIVKGVVRADIAVYVVYEESGHAADGLIVLIDDVDHEDLILAGEVHADVNVAVGHGEVEHMQGVGSVRRNRITPGIDPGLGRDDAVGVIQDGHDADILRLDGVLVGQGVDHDADLVAGDGVVHVVECAGAVSAFLQVVVLVGLEDDEVHAALGGVILVRIEAVDADGVGHSGSQNRDDVEILGTLVDHLEVVEVVQNIGDVFLIVDAEGNHVVLGPTGLGHGDRDIILVSDGELGLGLVGIVVHNAGLHVDGNLPQTLAGQDVAGFIHAAHGDDEGLGVEDCLDINAACGHFEGVDVDSLRGHHVFGLDLETRAVVLAGDDESVRILLVLKAEAVAGHDAHEHLVAGVAAVDGEGVGRVAVGDGADAGNDGGAEGGFAVLKVGFDLDVLAGHLEVAVKVGFVVRFLNIAACGDGARGVSDSELHEGDTVGVVVKAQVEVLAHGDRALDALDDRDLIAGLGEVRGLAVPGDGEAAVVVAGLLGPVQDELRGDVLRHRLGDRRGDGDAALGHLERVVAGFRVRSVDSHVPVIADVIAVDLEAVAGADHVIADLAVGLVQADRRIAFLVDGNQVDIGTGHGFGDELAGVADALGVEGIDIAELRGHDQDVIALACEGDGDINVESGHDEAVAVHVDLIARGTMLHNGELNRLIPFDGLGNDGDLRALGGTGNGAAVDLKVEGAVGRIVDIEGVGRNRLEDDLQIHVRIGHDEGLGGAHSELDLCGGRDDLLVGRVDRGNLVVGISALDDDRRALDSRLHGDAADGGAGLAAVVCVDVDVVAGLDGGINTNVTGGHHEGVGSQQEVGLAVGLLDRQALDGLAGVGAGHDGDLRADSGSGDGLVVHVEEHRAVGGGHTAGKLVELGSGGGARGGGAVAVGDGGGGRRGGGGAGVAGAGHGDRQRHGVEELAAGLDRRQVVGLVEDLEQTLVGAVADTLGADDAVGRVTAGDGMLHDAVAGGADGRGDRRRDDEGVPCSDLVPAGDVVHLLDERGKDREVDAQRVAHAGDGLAVGHGVGHQVVGKRVGARCRDGGRGVARGGGADGGRAGDGGAGHIAGGRRGGGGAGVVHAGAGAVGDQQRVIIACGQIQRSADGQLVPLAVRNVVEDHDRVLAGVVIQAQTLADPQDKVALRHRILDDVGAIVVGCVGSDRQPRKQGHDHQYRKQHTNDPFLHSCSP